MRLRGTTLPTCRISGTSGSTRTQQRLGLGIGQQIGPRRARRDARRTGTTTTRDAGTTPASTSASRVARDPHTTRAARRMPAISRCAMARASGERRLAPGQRRLEGVEVVAHHQRAVARAVPPSDARSCDPRCERDRSRPSATAASAGSPRTGSRADRRWPHAARDPPMVNEWRAAPAVDRARWRPRRAAPGSRRPSSSSSDTRSMLCHCSSRRSDDERDARPHHRAARFRATNHRCVPSCGPSHGTGEVVSCARWNRCRSSARNVRQLNPLWSWNVTRRAARRRAAACAAV